MSHIESDKPLQPSLLDRLIDDEPYDSVEPGWRKSFTIRDLKESVRRDLEDLLNTRLLRPELVEEDGELASSLLTYGLPDLSTWGTAGHGQRERLKQTVKQTVERFEPRLVQVEVEVHEPEGRLLRSLHITISGLLHVEPLIEPIAFDTSVETSTGAIEVTASS